VQLSDAQEALARCLQRRAAVERDLTDVQGQLKGKGSEELHARRCGEEQAWRAVEREAARIALEVEAHRVLLELFAAARDESVNRAIEPVSERLARWLPLIHGREHVQVDFGADLGVKALTVPDVGSFPEDTKAVSYGEREQLAVLVRLAYGAALAGEERQLVLLDDPLAHADGPHHGRVLDVLGQAANENLQIIVLTCHPERFSGLQDATFLELQAAPTP
jgi:exonuclease SbcC